MTALLQITDLNAFYGPTQALHNVSLAIEEGGITALLGANGAGKTTTLRAICQMVRTRGMISLDGKKIDQLATEAIVRAGVAHVPDGRGTFSELTVEENLRLGACSRTDKREVAQDFERMYNYFPRLSERRRQQAGTLSGGEQQMLAISRALMLRPRLLLLDEPSFGVAPIIIENIFGILQEINQNQKVSMLLVEQNADIALSLATYAYLIETGCVVLSGTSESFRGNETIKRVYLGY